MNTAEFVSPGHPDKIADQVSDKILDWALDIDAKSKVAIETMITGTNTGGSVILGGEMSESTYLEIEEQLPKIVQWVIYKNITTSFADFNLNTFTIEDHITLQSPEIKSAVNKEDQGAGDQGIMIGYATNETPTMLPVVFDMARSIQKDLWKLQNDQKNLGLDSKVQVTCEDKTKVVVSCQTNGELDEDVQVLIKELVANHIPEREHTWTLEINPSGSFQKGGPAADTGLTGRKIVVDAYGPTIQVGGGAYSGKDPSKVDRSGAYACRHLAVNLVQWELFKNAKVEVSYAIGKADPYELNITGEQIASDKAVKDFINKFDFRPSAIIERLDLLTVEYHPFSQFSHYGDPKRNWEKIIQS